MPVGGGGGVKRVGLKGWKKYSIYSARRALHHPHPRAFCTLPSFARNTRPRWQPIRRTQRSTYTISRKNRGL